MQPGLPFRNFEHDVWRLVEGQHVIATMRLVDSAGEQAILEDILELTKPPVPPPCSGLHPLLFTPFRYGLYPVDSRFRRRGETPGVFYVAEDPVTAVAETVWRQRDFFKASPQTPLPDRPGLYTGFCVPVRSGRALDLMAPPLDAGAATWTDPDAYGPCQDLADRARVEGAEVIRYASVRHPEGWPAVAVLDCRAFAARAPVRAQTWHLHLRPGRTQALRENPRTSLEFAFGPTRLSFT